jgi:hypothetical protein
MRSSFLKGAALSLAITATAGAAPSFALSVRPIVIYPRPSAQALIDEAYRANGADLAARLFYHPYYGRIHYYRNTFDKDYDFGYGFGCAIERVRIQRGAGARWANVGRCY